MFLTEFNQMLGTLLPSVSPTTLTLTELPREPGALKEALERAIVSGNLCQTPLTAVHLPSEFLPQMGILFNEISLEDSGSADVVRLFFEPGEAGV
jgi:hypothetical protein